MKNNMDKEYWEKQLEMAMSKYDFDLMKEAVKNGAEPDDTILHRVINRDRVDLIKYFCFSPELPKHCNINYKYDYFGDDAPFVYACSCGAVESVKFILRDERVSHQFNMNKNAYRGFGQACISYRPKMVDFLLKANETKEYCRIENNDFEIMKFFNREDRHYKIEPLKEILEYLIMNLEFNVVQNMKKYIVNHKDMFKPILDARELHESLSNSLGINHKDIRKNKI
jgi:hypothetical protein